MRPIVCGQLTIISTWACWSFHSKTMSINVCQSFLYNYYSSRLPTRFCKISMGFCAHLVERVCDVQHLCSLMAHKQCFCCSQSFQLGWGQGSIQLCHSSSSTPCLSNHLSWCWTFYGPKQNNFICCNLNFTQTENKLQTIMSPPPNLLALCILVTFWYLPDSEVWFIVNWVR